MMLLSQQLLKGSGTTIAFETLISDASISFRHELAHTRKSTQYPTFTDISENI